MDEIAELTKFYPHFADGRIDYTNERVCPVINCTVLCGNEVLLAYRSAEVIAYPETWNGISGFIDELQPLESIIKEELLREVNIHEEDIKGISLFDKLIQEDEAINREWHVYPMLVELKRKPLVKTNWEHKEAKWVAKDKVLKLALMPFYAETFKIVMEGRL